MIPTVLVLFFPFQDKKEVRSVSEAPKSKSYGGLKKGFLFSSNQPKSKKTSDEHKHIPVIKPNTSEKSNLELPEVQEAMKAGEAFSQNTSKKSFITCRVFFQLSFKRFKHIFLCYTNRYDGNDLVEKKTVALIKT